ncbi:TonB-dependent siderophore receptor [Kingella potus]|uniref:TonB-dependent siderophore receptor n=1 Tax=Kingella potus TaxID=265175 RepID=UPI001FD4FEBE|nr:TonB-dependent receptor plug domain-containing protein [Kingella potus]UOP01484.1 TonB-dependent receptor [Kingella potus]
MKTGILISPAAVLLAAFSAAAADTGDKEAQSAQLEEVRVQGESRSTRTEHRDSFTTSAMRTTTGLALSPQETPQSVSVVTQTLLDGRGITNLEDALRTTTGVTVLRDSDRARFQSRGFYIDQIEEDGIASAISGHAGETIHNAESLTDLALYDHIEVVRGATGLTQADGEPGGTVNAVRKRPTAERSFGGGLSFGRFDTYRADIDASGRLNAAGSIRGRFVAAAEKAGSFVSRVNSRQHLLYGVADFDLGDNTVLTAGAVQQKRRAVPDIYGLPRGSVENPLDLPRGSYSGAYWNNSRFSKTNVFAELRHRFGGNWRLSSQADYRRDRAVREYSALSSTRSWQNSNGSIWGSGSRRSDNTARQATFHNILTGSFQALDRSHDVFATYTYTRRRSRSDTMQHWDLWIDPNDPNNQFCAGQGWPVWCTPELSRDFPLHPFNGALIPRPQWDKLAELDYRYNPIRNQAHLRQGGYTLWNADVQYVPGRNLRLSLIADNLFDKRYFENNANRGNGSDNFYGTPRTLAFKLGWQF